jgi:hypothetical protein
MDKWLPVLRLSRSRLWPLVTLASIYLYLIALLGPWWLENNLLKGDGAGHLFLVEFTSQYLLPFGSGWCDRVWGGIAIGQLYPPLFHLIGGALAKLTGAVIAVKVLVTLTWLAIPLGLYLIAQALSSATDARRPRPGLHATLLLAGWCGLVLPSQVLGIGETLGTNLESSIGNGMYPSAAGCAAWLFGLYAVLSRGHRAPLLVATALALTVLLHPVWGLFGAVTCLVATGADLLRPQEGQSRIEALRGWAAAGLLAFCISAFFAVPFLANASHVHSTHIPLHWPMSLWWPVAAAGALSILYWKRLPRPLRVWAATAGVLLLGATAGDAAAATFHFYRLTLPLTLLSLVLLSYLLYRPWSTTGDDAQPPQLRRTTVLLRTANFIMLLALAFFFHLQGPIHPRGNPELPAAHVVPASRLNGRIAVLTQPLHSPGYMALPWAVTAGGGAASHGISVESSRVARAIFGLLRKLSPKQYVWGVDMHANPANRVPDPEGQITERQLALLGFSHILTDRRTLPAATAPLPGPPALLFPNYVARDPASLAALQSDYYLTPDGSSLAYHLHPLRNPSLVDSGLSFHPVPDDRFEELTERWFAMGGEAPVPVVGLQKPLQASSGCSAEATAISDSGDRLDLQLTGCPASGAGIYIKIPHHLNWRAKGPHGEVRELLPAGYGMLLLAGEGMTSIEYTSGATEWFGRALTLLGLLLAGSMALYNRKPKAT